MENDDVVNACFSCKGTGLGCHTTDDDWVDCQACDGSGADTED